MSSFHPEVQARLPRCSMWVKDSGLGMQYGCPGCRMGVQRLRVMVQSCRMGIQDPACVSRMQDGGLGCRTYVHRSSTINSREVPVTLKSYSPVISSLTHWTENSHEYSVFFQQRDFPNLFFLHIKNTSFFN